MSSPPQSRDELEKALGELEADKKAKRAPNRYSARAVLVPLGLVLLEHESEESLGESHPELRPLVDRARSIVQAFDEAPFDGAFRQAVQEELALAGAEHVHSVDPRFLEHPRYDFAYTLGARERLEARLVAARALEIEIDEGLLEQIARADERLQPYLRD